MESPAGANASSAGAASPSPAAGTPAPSAAPQQDRKRGRAAWAAEQHAANQAFKLQHTDDEAEGSVDIRVVDDNDCVLW
jgi:hypothetical protein